MAPRAGLEPATDRLTADCSTTELLRIRMRVVHSKKSNSRHWVSATGDSAQFGVGCRKAALRQAQDGLPRPEL